MQLLTQWFLHSSSVSQPCWVLLPGLIHCTRPIILHVLMLKLSAQHSVPGHLPPLCWKMCLTVKCQVHLPTCAAFRWRLLMFGRAHHISIDFICQNGDAMSGGHWGDTGDSSVSQSVCAEIIAAEGNRRVANLWGSSECALWWRRSHRGWRDW